MIDAPPPRAWYLGATPLATLPWLIRLRWTTATMEAVVAVVVSSFPRFELPLEHLSLLLFVSAMNNAALALWLSRGRALPRVVSAIGLALEIVLLTGLLELTGGPLNPFSVVYVVQVTLAALTLGTLWASMLGGFALACYGLLIYWHTHELVPGHHRLNDFPTHLFTLWISAAVTAELVAHFVVQVSGALVRREAELEAMRLHAARTERLVSLTTLAAGAAHELSTPLATIALASRELEHAAAARGSVPDLAEDARLIRSEVDRCRAILDQMSGRAGGIAPDAPALLDLSAVIAEVRTRLTDEQAGRLEVRIPDALQPVFLPRSGLAQVVLSLVKNAFDATGDAPLNVKLEVSRDAETLRVSVQDQGPGVPPDVLRHAGEPFFTTKEPGRGLGLGLFLARVFAERFGGTLQLRSDEGTTAVLEAAGDVSFDGARMIETVTPPREGRSLLIVDDDGPFRTRLMRAFADRGFDVRGAADFTDAMTAAKTESPELALVDLRLPGQSGLELVRALKDLDPATSIVVLTGYGSIATAVESLQLGATSYLTKPVDADQILAAFDNEPRGGVRPMPAVQPLARVEWEHIQRVLADCDGNISQAARLLGIHRRSLQRKLLKDPVRENSVGT